MKYLKLYENDIREKFWLINCNDDAYFLASLYSINIEDKESIEEFFKIKDYVFDKYSDTQFYLSNIGYMPYNGGYNWYQNRGLIYAGEIKPTKKKIKLAELKIDVNKYNI